MTFLNPAILFGLIAAAIPIVLHFLNLRKLKTIEFSTLAFLKELQKTKIRRIKLKQWLLLLLRTLIIILLVMAFARPAVKSVTIGSSSTAKTTAVIIIDNTFSMSVVSSDGSYLNKAKRIAKSLLNNFQQGDDIVILPTAGGPNDFQAGTTNFLEAKKAIDEIEVADPSRTVNTSMISAVRILYQSKNFNKEIYLLTDCQKSRLYNSVSELSNYGSGLSPETRLFLVDVGEKETVNLGIESLQLNNQIFEKGKAISVSARVKNYSGQSINGDVISLFINGRRSAQQNISLSGGEAREISFETTLQDTGLVAITTELEDDDILQDNRIYTSIYVPDKISLLALYNKPDDLKFIKLALGIPGEHYKYSEIPASQLGGVNFKSYNTLIIAGFDDLTSFSKLEDFLQNGGNVIIIPGSQSKISTFQNLCDALKIASPAKLVGTINGKESVSQFGKIDFQHPLLKEIYLDKSKNQIQSPEILAYYKLPASSKGKTIISLVDNSSFLAEYKSGNGKLIVFNSPINLGWNDFPLKSIFAPLMNKMILYCSTRIKEEQNIFAGDELKANISGFVISQVEVEKPNLIKEYFRTDSLSNRNYLDFKSTDQIGIYKFTGGGKLLDYFAVNHDPRESFIEKYSVSEFESYAKHIGFNGKVIPLSSNSDFAKEIYQSRFGTELWKYFLILALILAIAESFVARSSKRELVQQ